MFKYHIFSILDEGYNFCNNCGNRICDDGESE